MSPIIRSCFWYIQKARLITAIASSIELMGTTATSAPDGKFLRFMKRHKRSKIGSIMELSDNEKRDAIKFIEAGKPLPDKYRFLLFGNKEEVELVWNGKTDEVTNVVLPFQTIEQVDEPRSEEAKKQTTASLFDMGGRQISGWTNKLIWGDNKLVLSSLKNGPLRQEIEAQGGIKLIYIDPPFDVGADFSMNIEIGDEEFSKRPSVLEELAYRDTWGKGADSFIAMIYERLSLMRDLLAEDGSIFVHCDWRVSSYIKLALDEIFGNVNFRSTIAWKKATKTTAFNEFGTEYDSIIVYSRNYEDFIFNQQFRELAEEQIDKNYKFVETTDGEIVRLTKKQVDGLEPIPNGRRFRAIPITNMNKNRPNLRFEFLGHVQTWAKSRGKLEDEYERGLIFQTSPGTIPVKKQYLDENKGVKVNDIWVDIAPVQGGADENTNYPTQKPEALIERIIKASSNEGDLVADFFTGSGTTVSAAEKLGRKWIGSDLGKFAIHTTRKRMIGVQRALKAEGKDYRAFEILNLGKYERQHYVGVNLNLREEEREKQLAQREKDFTKLILSAYKAEGVEGFKTFAGKKNSRLVAIGPINLPVSRLFVEEVIGECVEKKITRVDILAFEFEMGLFPQVQEEAKEKGIDLALKYIPREVFDKRAIEKNQVVFNDVSFIEVKPIVKKNTVAIELADFSVFYNQDSIKDVEESLKAGGTKIIVEQGTIIKVAKDKDGVLTREVLTKKWTDWIDYWAVDFNYESKKEIVQVKNNETGEVEERWTGDYIFENEWQDFRTKKKRDLELVTPPVEVGNGKHKIAIKVVDIFGNDTMKVIEISL